MTNIFYGPGLGTQLGKYEQKDGATVFAYQVADPRAYGVVEFDKNFHAVSIEENRRYPKAIMLFRDYISMTNMLWNMRKNIKPSQRGELEITDLNRVYLNR